MTSTKIKEIGWIIEFKLSSENMPLWWAGISAINFINNSLYAVRFSREIDAEIVLANIIPPIYRNLCKVTEYKCK